MSAWVVPGGRFELVIGFDLLGDRLGSYPDSTVLERIGDDPAAFGERLAVDLLDLGENRPALTPLFEFGTDLEMPVPSNSDRDAVARIETRKGHVCLDQGAYDQARVHYRRSLELARELGDRQGEANSLGSLGLIAQSQGDYDDAREYFRRANEQFREIGSFRNALTTFENLVDVCEEMDDTESAIEWCERDRDWAGTVDRIDLSDTAAEFERRRLRLDVSKEAT